MWRVFIGAAAACRGSVRRRCRSRSAALVLAGLLFYWPGVGVARAGAGEVDLVLAPATPTVGVGDVVDIELYAVSTTGGKVGISALSVVLTWDPSFLELRGFANNPAYNWLLSGFLTDSGADGLNDAHDDGDAFFQALGQFAVPAVATPEGFLITTFKFNALSRTERATVRLEPQRGAFSRTEVFRFGEVDQDVVGALTPGTVAIASGQRLWPLDLSVRAGRTGDVIVYGEFADAETFGVRIQAEIVPQPGVVGTVTFTPAPPEDVFQAGDPWNGAGSFTPFDTNTAGGQLMLNGSVADNGTFLAEPLAYWGPLTGMPVVAGADAAGVWTVRLDTSAGSSGWEPPPGEELETLLQPGVIRVVAPHDGDGSGTVDVADYAELQRCFTGPVGPADPPAFNADPRQRCAIYDDDADGDIDGADVASFIAVQTGPNVP